MMMADDEMKSSLNSQILRAIDVANIQEAIPHFQVTRTRAQIKLINLRTSGLEMNPEGELDCGKPQNCLKKLHCDFEKP